MRWQRDFWKSDEWETVFHFINNNAATCTARALINERPDLVEVIDRMVKEFEPLEEDELRYVE